MPKLIVVYGTSNSGKTSSVVHFVENYRNVTASPFPELITFPIQKNGNWLLGVAKDGDSARHVQSAVGLFASRNCDIVVCTTKSRGASVRALNAFVAANPHITVVSIASSPTAAPALQVAANAAVALAIEQNIP
ncbi:hypothetical protein V6L77_12350 [Pannonibacter sp. Pt2-lr]|uniref:GTPase n=1 Tax=Pannonibacter anstelovis TaxID=3121537 RepID=A0ABU7ZKV1_9HYPH